VQRVAPAGRKTSNSASEQTKYRQVCAARNAAGNYTHYDTYKTLECGPMPNLMVALPIIGGALCPTPQSLADDHY